MGSPHRQAGARLDRFGFQLSTLAASGAVEASRQAISSAWYQDRGRSWRAARKCCSPARGGAARMSQSGQRGDGRSAASCRHAQPCRGADHPPADHPDAGGASDISSAARGRFGFHLGGGLSRKPPRH
jgi:hypothetical protein